MSGEQEPWVFRGGLTADLQVSLGFIQNIIISYSFQKNEKGYRSSFGLSARDRILSNCVTRVKKNLILRSI